jgi:ribosomal protein L44E
MEILGNHFKPEKLLANPLRENRQETEASSFHSLTQNMDGNHFKPEKLLFQCSPCSYQTDKKSSFDKHLLTTKHGRATFLSQKSCSPLKEEIFRCELCAFQTCKKGNYEKHLSSGKHQQGSKTVASLSCETCGKTFQTNSGRWKHQSKCSVAEHSNTFLQHLVKENVEFKQLMAEQNSQIIEMAKQTTMTNAQMMEWMKTSASSASTEVHHHHTTTTNTTNNFNLNFFLNDTCKNAMNIMDFVSQLQVGLKELEEMGNLKFVDGISKIFIDGLRQLDISNRPLFCSDLKREILYVKNNNEWKKEAEDKPTLTVAINQIVNKNIHQLLEWDKKYPEHKHPESKANDQYLHMVMETMPGNSQEECKTNYGKIMKNIMKESVIPKGCAPFTLRDGV